MHQVATCGRGARIRLSSPGTALLLAAAAILCGAAFPDGAPAADSPRTAPVPTDDGPAGRPRGCVKGPRGEFQCVPPERRESAVIGLKSLDFATVEAVCRPLLSPDGALAWLDGRSSVFVMDTASIVGKVRELIEQMDCDPVNVSISIDFVGAGASRSDGIAVDAGGRPRVAVENGRVSLPSRVAVGAADRRSRARNDNSMSLTVANGRSASLWVGTNTLDPAWLGAYSRRTTVVLSQDGRPFVVGDRAPILVMRDVGASLQVSPSVRAGGWIDLEIYPEVSYLDGSGRRRRIKVESLATRVTLKDGARVNIGGALSSKAGSYRELFGEPLFAAGSASASEALDIYATATVRAHAPAAPRDAAVPPGSVPPPLRPAR